MKIQRLSLIVLFCAGAGAARLSGCSETHLIFVHVPKTGGETIYCTFPERTIMRSFCAPMGHSIKMALSRIHFTAREAMTDLRCASFEACQNPCRRWFTMLRDPVARVESNFRHHRTSDPPGFFRCSPELNRAKLNLSISFDEFVRLPGFLETCHFDRDATVRMLADGDLGLAKARLLNMSFGITERFADTMALLGARTYAPAWSHNYQTKGGFSAETRAFLEAHYVRKDVELYRFALREFERRAGRARAKERCGPITACFPSSGLPPAVFMPGEARFECDRPGNNCICKRVGGCFTE